jgi:hypothetical protein
LDLLIKSPMSSIELITFFSNREQNWPCEINRLRAISQPPNLTRRDRPECPPSS